MINSLKWLGVVWIVVMLAGCGGLDTIPADKEGYIGTWYGQYMVLSISPDAKVDYHYRKGNTSKSITAPIIEFIGDDFKVGALGMDTVFVVSTPPYFADGVWKMVVDDQLLMREEMQSRFPME